jgi:DNA topoisomerase-2
MSTRSKKAAQTYQSLEQNEHVLHRPDMYIGSIKFARHEYYSGEKYVKDEEKGESLRIVKKNGMINPGLHRIFIEILSNSIDNYWRSSETDTPCTKIKVDIDEQGCITVWNDGLTIPIQIDQASGLYNPDLIFGKLLTSSNYNDEEERMTSGKNGLGSKATNIFSKEFSVKIFDPDSGHQYVQKWKNNMSEKDSPKITSPKQKNGYTQISFLPDYQRFGCENLSEEMRGLFFKNVIDTAMITGVNVHFNDSKIPIKNMKDYALLYEDTNMVMMDTKDSQVVLAVNPKVDDFSAISFVNGIETAQGGVHVDSWSEAIFRPILDKLNGVKKDKEDKKDKEKLTMRDIKPYFRLFLKCTVPNPAFTSQEKSKLASPNVTVDVLQKHINAVMKWPVMEEIKELMKSREMTKLKKTEKKKGFVKIEGLDPANLAGTKHANECSLILCEGDSAKTFAVKGIQTGVYSKKGRDYFGIYPLRGKCLNVRNSNVTTISKNKEITDVIKALNLKYESDYTVDDVYDTLAYGRVIILTDSDVDGYHICGLLLNFFHKLFPTLLERNPSFITCMRTPIVRIYYPRSEMELYTLEDFRKYQRENPTKKGDVKYFKGLGTNNNKEIETSFGRKMIEFVKDEKTDDTMDKVFHSKFSDQRKKWLEEYDPTDEKEIVSKSALQLLPISDFLNNEMIKFSIDDCKRSIPGMMDGLKESHRKIMYATFLKNLKYAGKTMKVAQLAGFVAEKTNYHHGEQCLFDTITKLAHDFVGSNNIPFLYRDGQFGSRIDNGKDAANARYIFTKLDVLTRLLFRQEDDVLLDYVYDDGDKVEPKYYAPILPTVLINGCTAGIGTGWSSQIPCYNPIDLVSEIKKWLGDQTYEFNELVPWYRGFTGTIEKSGDTKYISKGMVAEEKVNRSTRKVVRELPIGMAMDKFKEFVEDCIEEKKIKSYKNYSTDVLIHFELEEMKEGMELTEETLKLSTSLSTNNMVLFDEKGAIKKYEKVGEIMADFCGVRFGLYEKRKEHILNELKQSLKIVKNKMRFLREVMEESLVIQDVDEDVIVKELVTRKYDGHCEEAVNSEENEEKGTHKKYQYLLNMPVKSFSKQKLASLQEEIDKLEKEVERVKKLTPSVMWLNDLSEFEQEYNKVYKK